MTAPPPRVLVTGAAGYIGRLVVAELARRVADPQPTIGAVVSLDVSPVASEARLPAVTYVTGDICAPLVDLCTTHRIDTIVHLATIVRLPPGAAPDLAWRVDVDGTRNVLEASLQANVRRLVVTSSGAAYGYHEDNPEWLHEDDALRGNEDFPYAHHKKVVEEMLADWRDAHPELEQVVFRPGTVIGESVHSPITDLFEKPVIVGVRGSRSPFVFIWDTDVVACIVAAVLGGPPGIYNLAGDGALSPDEIARRLSKPYVPVPARLLGGALFALKALGLTEHGPERVKFLRFRPVLANDRLKRDFGYTPRMTSAEAFDAYARARGLIQ